MSGIGGPRDPGQTGGQTMARMKYFHAPMTCSIGLIVLLEEIGADYELITIQVSKGEQHNPEFRAINPKGKVPALVREDGSVLTEFPAIAMWLAKSVPQANLLPPGLEAEIRAMELMEFVVSTAHMRGGTLAMLPGKFSQNDAAQKDIAEHGRKIIHDALDFLAERLGDKDFFLGTFSIVDATVFYLLQWKDRAGLDIPPTLEAFQNRMKARPAVQRALAA